MQPAQFSLVRPSSLSGAPALQASAERIPTTAANWVSPIVSCPELAIAVPERVYLQKYHHKDTDDQQRLSTSLANVSQKLRGTSNLTLRTVADGLEACAQIGGLLSLPCFGLSLNRNN